MKYAFVDANGALIAWGFMEANSDDTRIEVDLSFCQAMQAHEYR